MTNWNGKFDVETFKSYKPIESLADFAGKYGKFDPSGETNRFPGVDDPKEDVSMNIGGTRPFTAEVIKKNICQISPVLGKIVKTIEAIDAVDQRERGKTFKHSVFTNTAGRAGAKMMAAVFKAFGYYIPKAEDFRRGGRELVLDPHPSDGQRVALVLSSTAMGKVKTNQNNYKMAVLNYYNARANANGRHAPVILLDAGFIEGTSLFDVKYAHIAEPPVSMAAFEQAVARSVRRCHSGAVPWEEGLGHVVDVYTYRATYGPWAKKINKEGKEDDPKYVFDSVQRNNTHLQESKIIDQFTLLSMRTAVDYYLNERVLEFKIPSFNYAIDRGASVFGFSSGDVDEEADFRSHLVELKDRDPVSFNKFRGTFDMQMRFVEYLRKRYTNMRVWRGSHGDKRLIWDCPDKDTSRKRYLTWRGRRDLVPFFEAVNRELNHRPDVRFFLVPIDMSTKNCLNTVGGSHLNMLIFDKLGGRAGQGTIELFEPHGATEYLYDTTELQNTIQRFAHENEYFRDYQFISPLEICPSGESFQRIEGREEGQRIRSDPGGWCVAWSFFYAENRLKYPDYTPQKLVRYLLENLKRHRERGSSFTEFIREYSNYATRSRSRARDGGGHGR